MIQGIVLGSSMWNFNIAYSKFWTPEKYGVNFTKICDWTDFPDPKELGKFDFLLATDVMEIKPRKALELARQAGLKIFFIPREPIGYLDYLFSDKKFLHNGKCYFTPDVVLASGRLYADHWKDKTKVYTVGHPRFDFCFYDNFIQKDTILEKFGLDKEKKILFFPSTPIFSSRNFIKYPNYKDYGRVFGDVHDDREKLLEALLEFSTQRDDIQVVIKLHPQSSAVLRKKGRTKDIEGITLKYLNNPTKKFRVIDEEKQPAARDLLTVCDFIVASNTTMMVEGTAMGKPVLRAMMGISDNVMNYSGYADTFESSNGYDETIKKLHEMVGTGGFKARGNMEDYTLQDTKSCERICDVIKSELDKK